MIQKKLIVVVFALSTSCISYSMEHSLIGLLQSPIKENDVPTLDDRRVPQSDEAFYKNAPEVAVLEDVVQEIVQEVMEEGSIYDRYPGHIVLPPPAYPVSNLCLPKQIERLSNIQIPFVQYEFVSYVPSTPETNTHAHVESPVSSLPEVSGTFPLDRNAFECPVLKCGNITTNKMNYRVHLINKHRLATYYCFYHGCKKKFERSRIRNNHLKDHKTWECCHTTFTTWKKYITHRRSSETHKKAGKSSFCYPCQFCEQLFFECEYDLFFHYISDHRDEFLNHT